MTEEREIAYSDLEKTGLVAGKKLVEAKGAGRIIIATYGSQMTILSGPVWAFYSQIRWEDNWWTDSTNCWYLLDDWILRLKYNSRGGSNKR